VVSDDLLELNTSDDGYFLRLCKFPTVGGRMTHVLERTTKDNRR
jgi:hypothetical protein